MAQAFLPAAHQVPTDPQDWRRLERLVSIEQTLAVAVLQHGSSEDQMKTLLASVVVVFTLFVGGCTVNTPPGQPGPAGQPGQTGQSGQTGQPGQTGTTGDQGQTGVTGQQGQTGVTGDQGQTGVTGEQGQTGQTGAQGQPAPRRY